MEGNIASGKSTLLRNVRRIAPSLIKTIPEPINKWRKLQGENILDLLYQDPKRWSFPFNFHMILNRLQLHSITPSQSYSIHMMERSFHSTFKVFVQDSMNSGNLSTEEYLTLKGHFEMFSDPKSSIRNITPLWPYVDLFVYIRVSPEIAIKRLKRRRRKEEKGIEVEFLRRLHELHEAYFLPDENGCNQDGIPVLVVENEEKLTPDICHDIVNQISKHPVIFS